MWRPTASPWRWKITRIGNTGWIKKAPPTRETWGHLPSLPDHFERHGRDFNAKDADDYARMAWEFQQRAKIEGLPDDKGQPMRSRVFKPDEIYRKTRNVAPTYPAWLPLMACSP